MSQVDSMRQALPQLAPLSRQLLHDKVALVTGGSRGIGRATAQRLAEAGAHVVLNYMREHDAAVSVARDIEKLNTGVALAQGDVSDPEQMERVVEAAIRTFGRLDLLVANAGVWEGAPIETM